MPSRRRTVTTAASQRSTPPPSNVLAPVRRSPLALHRLNYREKRARSSSSMGSTGRTLATQTCLKISLKATLLKSFGETEYCGSGVFLLPENTYRSSLHVRTRKILTDVLGAGIDADLVDPVKEVSGSDYDRHRRLYREHRRKMRENAAEIARAEADLAEKPHARELTEARVGKRKVGEPSEFEKQNPPSPYSGEMAAVKEEEESEEEGPSPHVRIRSRSTPPSGAPSDW